MTWLEIKKAADEAGVKDDEEICSIACQMSGGSKELHKVTIGRTLKLAEPSSQDAKKEALGCAT